MNIKKNKYFIALIIVTITSTATALIVQFVKGEVINFTTVADKKAYSALTIFFLLIILELFTYLINNILQAKFVCLEKRKLEKKVSRAALYNNEIKLDYLTKYISTIENAYLNVLPQYIYAILRVIFMSFGLIYIDFAPFVIAFVFLTIPIYLPKLLSRKLNSLQEDKLEKYNKTLDKFNELTDKLKLIQFSSFKDRYIKNVEKLIENSTNSDERFLVYNAFTRLIASFSSYMAHFTIILYGVYNVINGNMTIGSIIVLLGLIEQLSYPIISISMMRQAMISTKSTREKLNEFIENDENTSKEIIEKVLSISLEDISYAVEEKSIINNFSYTFDENKKYLITGDSGSGKTTLSEIILDLNNYKGIVSYNDKNVKDINVFESVAHISSSEMVVCESVEFNINIDKYTLEEHSVPYIDNACDLSHGEQRRLSVLKGVIDNRSVIIFDEPFSNMQKAMQNQIFDQIINISNKIVIVISHDLLDRKDEFDEIINLNIIVSN